MRLKNLGFAAEGAQSGTSVNKKRLSYDGVRDSRRVLFQMALVLMTPKTKNNVFKEHVKKLINGRKNKNLPPMRKMKAMCHVCGKPAQVMYGCLKSESKYDLIYHAKACGIQWDKGFDENLGDVDIDRYEVEAEAEELAYNRVLIG